MRPERNLPQLHGAHALNVTKTLVHSAIGHTSPSLPLGRQCDSRRSASRPEHGCVKPVDGHDAAFNVAVPRLDADHAVADLQFDAGALSHGSPMPATRARGGPQATRSCRRPCCR